MQFEPTGAEIDIVNKLGQALLSLQPDLIPENMNCLLANAHNNRLMPKNLPPTQTLLAFQAVARLGSTVRAADHSEHYTPSAISHQLRKLENLLDIKLYQQKGRQIELTANGKKYAEKIGKALTLIAESSNDLDEAEPHGELTISCAEGIGSFWLSRRIGQFASLYPKLSINLLTPADNQDVYRNNVDLSIVYGDGNWKDMQVHLLHPLHFFPVCSPRLLENMGKLNKPERLKDYRLLHHKDHSNWAAWLAAAEVNNIEHTSGIVFSNINHSLSAAIAGHGVAIADNVLATDSMKDGSLVKLFDLEIPGPNSYYLVMAEEKSRQPASAACVEWILSEID